MPQMKPMLWSMMLVGTLMMIMMTIIINFFSMVMNYNKYNTQMKIKTMKWKW